VSRRRGVASRHPWTFSRWSSRCSWAARPSPPASLALGAVALTIGVVAVVVRLLVPDMPRAAAIALGAIVAPPGRGGLSLSGADPGHRLWRGAGDARGAGTHAAAAAAAAAAPRRRRRRARGPPGQGEALRAAVAATEECPRSDAAALVRQSYALQLRRAEEELAQEGVDATPGSLAAPVAPTDGDSSVVHAATGAQRRRLVALRADGTIAERQSIGRSGRPKLRARARGEGSSRTNHLLRVAPPARAIVQPQV
jgi:hypothetical protein